MEDNNFDSNELQRTPATTPAHRHPSQRQSLLLATNRRATMFFRTMDHTQPPEEDANNPPEVNAQRRREYETIKGLNHMIETVLDNFEKGRENIKQFTQTVDQTEHLLDLWISILSQAEHTKHLLDNPEWRGVNPPPEPSEPPQPANRDDDKNDEELDKITKSGRGSQKRKAQTAAPVMTRRKKITKQSSSK